MPDGPARSLWTRIDHAIACEAGKRRSPPAEHQRDQACKSRVHRQQCHDLWRYLSQARAIDHDGSAGVEHLLQWHDPGSLCENSSSIRGRRMSRITTSGFCSIVLFTFMLAIAGCGVGINQDIRVEAGEQSGRGGTTINGSIVVGQEAVVSDGNFRTVNGSIRLERGARVNDCATVNGSIRVDSASVTGTLETVNGSVAIREKVTVAGDMSTVNGSASAGSGSRVEGDVETVNGEIRLVGVEVQGGVHNTNGGHADYRGQPG